MKLFWLGFIVGGLVGILVLALITKKRIDKDESGTITCNDEGKLIFKFSKPFGWLASQDEVLFKIGKELKDAVKEDAEK